MSGYEVMASKLRSDFDAQMAANAATTLFAFENSAMFKVGGSGTPLDPPTLGSDTEPWCKHYIRTSDNVEVTSAFRHDFGFTEVDIFGEPNRGPKQVALLVEIIATNFRRRRVVISGRDVIQFGSVVVKELGIDPEGWYQNKILARFDRVDAQ